MLHCQPSQSRYPIIQLTKYLPLVSDLARHCSRYHDITFSWSGAEGFPASIPPPTPYTALSIVPVLLIRAVKTPSVILGYLPPLRRNAQDLASNKDETISERRLLSGEHLRV